MTDTDYLAQCMQAAYDALSDIEAEKKATMDAEDRADAEDMAQDAIDATTWETFN